MMLFLDDVREAPSGWVLVKTAPEAIVVLKSGTVTHLSLDHDLGEDPSVGNGYDVLLWLEEQVFSHGIKPPSVIKVHSSNAGARPKMESAIDCIHRQARARELFEITGKIEERKS